MKQISFTICGEGGRRRASVSRSWWLPTCLKQYLMSFRLPIHITGAREIVIPVIYVSTPHPTRLRRVWAVSGKRMRRTHCCTEAFRIVDTPTTSHRRTALYLSHFLFSHCRSARRSQVGQSQKKKYPKTKYINFYICASHRDCVSYSLFIERLKPKFVFLRRKIW